MWNILCRGVKLKLKKLSIVKVICRQIRQQRAIEPFIDWGRAAGAANWREIYFQKSCEKNWNGQRKIKRRGKLTSSACCRQVAEDMAAAGPWSLNWLRERGGCGQLKSCIIAKKKLWEKIGMARGKNKKEGKIHSHRLLQASHWQVLQRWAIVPFIDWGRVAGAANWRATELERGGSEKKSEWWGKN